MIIRANKVFEEAVVKALELAYKGDDFGALGFMKDQGLSNQIIARVLFQQNLRRSTDPSIKEESTIGIIKSMR